MEERANVLTHGLGLGIAIAASSLLMTTAIRLGSAWNIWGCGIYVVTLISAYTASTLSHLFESPRLRHAFRAADQAIIFLFIAGCWTAIAFARTRTPLGWIVLAAVWAVGLVGFFSKALFNHRVELGAVSLALYLFEGALAAAGSWPLLMGVHHTLLSWFMASCACYLAGTFFFIYDHRVRYFHAAWHIAVVAGSTCHYLGVLNYCTGWRP